MYTTLVRGLTELRAAAKLGNESTPTASSPSHELTNSKPMPSNLDVARLENRTLFSATPVVLDAFQVDSVEDAPNTEIDLHSLFGVDDGGAVSYSVIENSEPGIVESATVNDDTGVLTLDYAADAHGHASVTIEGVGADGSVELLTVEIELESVNDAPTAVNLQTVTVTEGGRTIIDLFAAFDDIEDRDEDLTYEILENTNESLFSSVVFDLEHGLLILEHAEGVTGTSELTLQATDTGRLSVGAGTSDGFQVFDAFLADEGVRPSEVSDFGLSELHLWTHWFFFEYVDGDYDYSDLATEKLTRVLEDLAATGDPSIPIVFDIETYGFDNTPEGRDAFAEAFYLANQIAPEYEIGLYRFLPERRWFEPVDYHVALQHAELNIASGYTARMEDLIEEYEQWKVGNSYYRTEDVTNLYGGEPLADMVDSINASLYTFYRNIAAEPIWRQAEFDAENDVFTVDGPSFESVEVVRIKRTVDGQLSNGMREWTDYYVVNADGNRFQLAATPGGDVLDFTDEYTGEIIVGAKTFDDLWHDPNVVYWEDYANENLAEAHKFDGKPIYAWVSPSVHAKGLQHLDGDFFRWQLEVLRPQVDGIVVYEPSWYDAEYDQNRGWWTALRDFMSTLDTPAATTTIVVSSNAEAPTNLPPLASSDTLETNEGESLDFLASVLLANDLDFDGDMLTLEITGDPSFGTLELIASSQWRYTPNQDFSGTDQFSYRVFDGYNYSDATTVEINVMGSNDRPVATDDAFTLGEDQSLKIYVAQLIANDYDPEGQALRFRLGDGPDHGSLSMNADGSLYYRPDLNFSGTDSFTYLVSDGVHDTTATVDLYVEEKNDRPIAVADRFEVAGSDALQISIQDLIDNDVDAEGDELTIVVTREPKHGSLIFDGSYYVYIPEDGFAGTDYFYYRVNDGSLDSMETLVQIEVAKVNTAPVARGESFVVEEDGHLVVDPKELLANDFDADSGDLEIVLVDAPKSGNVRWTRSGSLVYVPPSNYTGSDSFTYVVSDGELQSEIVTVELEVRDVNDAPVAVADNYTTQAGKAISVAAAKGVLANDSDPDGDRLRVELSRNASNGRVQLSEHGGFNYTPNRGFSGMDSFTYLVRDGLGGTALATASIKVEALLGFTGSLQPLSHSPFTFGGSITGAFGTLSGAPRSSDDDKQEEALPV